MDERARKRKLDEIDESDFEGIEKELPKQGLKLSQDKKVKKQKTSNTPGSIAKKSSLEDRNGDLNDEKSRLKKEKKRERQQEKQAEQNKAKEQVVSLPTDDALHGEVNCGAAGSTPVVDDEDLHGDLVSFEAEGLEDNPNQQQSSASPTPAPLSPIFDNLNEPSANTSTSSVIPPATVPKHIKLPADPERLRARLAARIEALRAARKADGPNGQPARNRQELMEARRKKEEQRRALKKEVRERQRREEDARREAALASARDSPASSMLSPIIRSPDNNFSFGRVAFADGQTLATDLSSLREPPKKKGPQDTATSLQASEKKRMRIAGLDDEKRADIEEKDLWLNAKKRAHGERVRDDTSLLKKTLKRKEKAKKKSEKEWGERKEGVAKSQAMKQKKREENLRKRNDEKGSKSKAKGKSATGNKGKKPKVKSRPGFEGSFGSGGKRR